MKPRSEPGPAKAAHHYLRAGEYYELAQDLLARAAGDAGAADILTDAAGALLYESAKQCVNAVANLNGQDPQANHEKMAELLAIANANPGYAGLINDSRMAWDLHIHADQAHLTPQVWATYAERTRSFIADMQSIYRATTPAPA